MRLSIIVPVYNVSKYIGDMLASVMMQSVKEMEVICVNDCSTDDSPLLIEQAAQQDSRIRLLHHEKNSGAGLARKTGIAASTGDYILFLDGDDALEDNACEELLMAMDKANVDILHFGTNVAAESNVPQIEIEGFTSATAPHLGRIENALIQACYVQHKFGITLWNKMYRGDIVRKAAKFFPEKRLNYAEDLLLQFMILNYAESYEGIAPAYYRYTFGAGITGGKRTTLKRMELFALQGDILNYLDEFLSEHNLTEQHKEARVEVCHQFVDAALYNWLCMIGPDEAPQAFDIIAPHFKVSDLIERLVHNMSLWGYNYDTIAERLNGSALLCQSPKAVKTVAAYYFRAHNGGIERVMCMLLDSWLQSGYRVILVTDQPEDASDYPYSENVERICLEHSTPSSEEEYRLRSQEIGDIIEHYSVDAFVYHAWLSKMLLWDLMTIKLTGASILIHTHSAFSVDFRSSSFEDTHYLAEMMSIYRLSDGVITLSDVDFSWWQLWHPNVFKTVNPTSSCLWKAKEFEPNNHDILWMGRISNEKKPEAALRILQLVRSVVPDARVHFVGKADTPERWESFLSQIDAMYLKDAAIVHGFQTEVYRFYESTCSYLSTSDFEGLPLTFMESKMAGIPCVTYDLPNLDMIRERKGMIVVPQNAEQAAADALIELMTNEEKWNAMSKEARASGELLCTFDQKENWSGIFKSLTREKVSHEPASISVAVQMMISDIKVGIRKREQERDYYRQQATVFEETTTFHRTQNEGYAHELDYYMKQASAFEESSNFFKAQYEGHAHDLQYYKDELEYYKKQASAFEEAVNYFRNQNNTPEREAKKYMKKIRQNKVVHFATIKLRAAKRRAVNLLRIVKRKATSLLRIAKQKILKQ